VGDRSLDHLVAPIVIGLPGNSRMTAPRIIRREAVVPVHQANALTGEVPCWDASRETLWWIDIQGQRLLGFSPRSGREQEHNLPSMPGLVVLRRSGGLVVGLEDGLYPFDPATGIGTRLVAVETDDTRTRINDGSVDAVGRLWFGTMDKTGSGQPIGKLYSADMNLRVMRTEIGVPNAIAFSPDGRTFYFADTPTGKIEACDYDADTATLGPSRTFIAYLAGERPDGVCVDTEGAIWIAVVDGGRLERRLTDGTLHTIVELPVSRPTMPMLGGSDGRALFITSQRRFLDADRLAAEPLAGDLLMLRTEVPGIAPNLVAF
jgi:sugar lactone lactonase YvrE